MGQVFKARHQHMQPRRRPEGHSQGPARQPGRPSSRFYQEVQLAATLSHPNIVLAYDAGQAGSNPLLRDGVRRGHRPVAAGQGAGPAAGAAGVRLRPAGGAGLAARPRARPGPPRRQARQPAGQPAPARTDVATCPTAAATAGDVVKLLDMGLARLQGGDDTGMTRLGAVIGTPDYMAPEQALNSRAADIRADLYSLGCTLLLPADRPAALRGRRTDRGAASAPDPEGRCPSPIAEGEAPAAVQAILDTLLAKDPDDRYQTPAELAEEMVPVCGAEALAGAAFRIPPRGGRPAPAAGGKTLSTPPGSNPARCCTRRPRKGQQGG